MQPGGEGHIGGGQQSVVFAFENFARRMLHQFPASKTAQVVLALMLRRRACHDGTRPVPQKLRRELEQVRARLACNALHASSIHARCCVPWRCLPLPVRRSCRAPWQTTRRTTAPLGGRRWQSCSTRTGARTRRGATRLGWCTNLADAPTQELYGGLRDCSAGPALAASPARARARGTHTGGCTLACWLCVACTCLTPRRAPHADCPGAAAGGCQVAASTRAAGRG